MANEKDISTQSIVVGAVETSNISHAISSATGDFELLYVNDAFLEVTGYCREDVIGKNCRFLQGTDTSKDVVTEIATKLKACQPIETDILNYTKGGTPFWNRLSISPVFDNDNNLIAFSAIQINISRLHHQLLQEEHRKKNEALGRLAANLNHEIKNIIQPIRLMSDTLADWKNLSENEITSCLEILNDSVELCESITRDILEFSKPNSHINQAITLSDFIEKTSRFSKTLLPQSVLLSMNNLVTSEHEHNLIICNMQRYLQVAANIIQNANEAMHKSGALAITFAVQTIHEIEAISLNINAGDYLVISYHDSGPGIAPNHVELLFSPFYSSKDLADGTGIGLSICKQYLETWYGTITAKNHKEGGAVFTTYIPLSK